MNIARIVLAIGVFVLTCECANFAISALIKLNIIEAVLWVVLWFF